MSGPSAFDRWWAARSINDRLSFLHHDRETYTREGWEAGAFTERARLREKVKALRLEAAEEQDRLRRMGYGTERMGAKVAAFLAVLALLDESGEDSSR